MIGVVAKLKVADGKEAEFEKHAGILVEKVNANEPDCVLYELFKSSSDPSIYVFMEKYANKAALDAHGKTDYFLAAQAPLGACLAGAPDIQVYNSIA